VRGRATLLSTTVLFAALVLGSFVILEQYEGQLVDNLDNTLEQQVADRVQLLENGGDNDLLTTVLQQEAFVWIGSPDGVEIAEGGGIFPLENPVPETIGGTSTVQLLVEERKPDEIEIERMDLRLASAQATTGQVVLAGAELEVIDNTIAQLAQLFFIAVPLLTLVVGGVTWFVTGRALQPVGAIRARAEAISGTSLADRVPVPETHDEIQHLATTVNQMLDRIERHDQAIRQFSSDASHELKSPIANIKAMVETRSSTDPSWHDVQHKLASETERLGELVDNLLYLSTQQDRVPTAPTTVALDELLFAEAELLSATTDLRLDLSGIEPAAVDGSASDLHRLVRNLVDNAARHANSRVYLSLSDANDDVILAVGDDGSGIPDEHKEAVFERFTRLDEARDRDAGGSGLGLSIVSQIAHAHGATVEVHDHRDGGASFEVRFTR